jgi:hypothetical protein
MERKKENYLKFAIPKTEKRQQQANFISRVYSSSKKLFILEATSSASAACVCIICCFAIATKFSEIFCCNSGTSFFLPSPDEFLKT